MHVPRRAALDDPVWCLASDGLVTCAGPLSGGGGKHLVGAATDSGVTFTGEPFEAGAIDEVNVTATVADQTGDLEQARRDRHRRPTHAEHLAEKLLGQGEGVAVDALVRLQQPARPARLQGMERIARDRL